MQVICNGTNPSNIKCFDRPGTKVSVIVDPITIIITTAQKSLRSISSQLELVRLQFNSRMLISDSFSQSCQPGRIDPLQLKHKIKTPHFRLDPDKRHPGDAVEFP